LPSSNVEPVEQIDKRDVQHQRRQPAFIEVLRDCVPDIIRHRIRTVVQPRHALGERKRRALVSGEPRRVVPGCYRQQPVVQFARSQLVFDSPFYTRAAPVDLAGTHVRQRQDARAQSSLLHGNQHLLNTFQCVGHHRGRVQESWLDRNQRFWCWGRRSFLQCWHVHSSSHRCCYLRQCVDVTNRKSVTDE